MFECCSSIVVTVVVPVMSVVSVVLVLGKCLSVAAVLLWLPWLCQL